MYLFHLVAHRLPSLYPKTRTSTIVPDVKCSSAVGDFVGLLGHSLMEHNKSTLLKNDACSSSIDPVISKLFVVTCRQPCRAIWHDQNHLRSSYSKRVLGLLVGTSKNKYAMSQEEGKIISTRHVPPGVARSLCRGGEPHIGSGEFGYEVIV